MFQDPRSCLAPQAVMEGRRLNPVLAEACVRFSTSEEQRTKLEATIASAHEWIVAVWTGKDVLRTPRTLRRQTG